MSFFRKRDSYSKLENILQSQIEDFEGIKELFTSKDFKKRVPPDVILEDLYRIEIPPTVEKGLKKFCERPNTKRVLSLGGGGAKGIAGNATLLYLIERLDLFDAFEEIWGSSAGSITGSAYASGLSAGEIIHSAATVRKGELMQLSISKTLKNTGLYSTQKILEFFKTMLIAKTFETCRKPFYCLATRFDGKSEKIEVFHQGDLAKAVVASMSIPDVFEPMEIMGNLYVDSGLIENTPCISVYQRHQNLRDTRDLAILSTCYGEDHFNPKINGLFGKLLNLMGVYRYQLQLEQLERTRLQPQTQITMINLDVPISKTDFNKMSPEIVPAYQQLLQKMDLICRNNNWNITI
jgi:predicted acylesterase/phospholipase RssA